MVQYGTRYGTALYRMVWYSMVRYSTARYSMVEYGTAWHVTDRIRRYWELRIRILTSTILSNFQISFQKSVTLAGLQFIFDCKIFFIHILHILNTIPPNLILSA
jgi:hypothetical protein